MENRFTRGRGMGAQGSYRESLSLPLNFHFVEWPLGLGFTPGNTQGSTGHDVSKQPGEGTLGRAGLL